MVAADGEELGHLWNRDSPDVPANVSHLRVQDPPSSAPQCPHLGTWTPVPSLEGLRLGRDPSSGDCTGLARAAPRQREDGGGDPIRGGGLHVLGQVARACVLKGSRKLGIHVIFKFSSFKRKTKSKTRLGSGSQRLWCGPCRSPPGPVGVGIVTAAVV